MSLIKSIFHYFKTDLEERITCFKQEDRATKSKLPFNKDYLVDLIYQHDILKKGMNRKGDKSPTVFIGIRGKVGSVWINNFSFSASECIKDSFNPKNLHLQNNLTIELRDTCLGVSKKIYRDNEFGENIEYQDGAWTNELINTISQIEDEILTMKSLLQEREESLLAERKAEAEKITNHFENLYEGKRSIQSDN